MIVADDSSDNTKKHFSDMTAFYEVPIYCYSDKVGLGLSLIHIWASGVVYMHELSFDFVSV